MSYAERLVCLASVSLRLRGEERWLGELSRVWGPAFCHGDMSQPHRSLASLQLSSLDQLQGDASPLFSRGDLVVLMRSESDFHAYIDGSFGSIEASLQVVIQRLLRARGGLLIHASAAVYAGEAWLIPGPSGAGKSTAARGGFERVLSDEMVALTTQASPVVWGTPFWSEGRDERRFPLTAEGCALKAITFPVKAARAKLDPLEPVEAARLLLRCVTSYEGAEPSAALFLLACELAEQVPAFRLSFPREGAWRGSLKSRALSEP